MCLCVLCLLRVCVFALFVLSGGGVRHGVRCVCDLLSDWTYINYRVCPMV